MFSVTKYNKFSFILSSILVGISLVLLSTWGLNLGIDFTGGSLVEFRTSGEIPTQEEIKEVFSAHHLRTPTIQSTNNGIIIRFEEVTEPKHQEIVSSLKNLNKGSLEEVRFETIGPVIGKELTARSIKAIIIVLIAIVAYVAWAFRRISKPVASWKYGVIALITLFHDVIIVVGLFVVLGKLLDWQISTSFIAALLTVLGYSVNDTIVVFDRVRENISHVAHSFVETIDMSVKQTVARSVNTSLTTLLVLGAIFTFGGDNIRPFILALMVGIIIGTYSSLFIASPLLALWYKQRR